MLSIANRSFKLTNGVRGYGLVGIVFSVAMFVFVVYLTLKISSLYYDSFVIHKEVSHLEQRKKESNLGSAEELQNYLKRQFEIGNIQGIKPDSVSVVYNPTTNAYDVKVAVQERAHIVSNLFLMLDINEITSVPRGE